MQQTVYLYAITMFKQYVSLLYFLIFAACSVTQNNIQNEPGNSTQSSHITISKADPNTAYLGKWQLLKLDGAPFVATPVLQRKQPNNPAAMSPVAASASIQFSPDGHFRATAGCNRLFGRQERVYPDFKLGPIGSTRMGCATSAEQVFTSALVTMTEARREDKQLILSNDAGREMLFSRY